MTLPISFRKARDGALLAVAEVGEGPGPPLFVVPGWVSHLELAWQQDSWRAFIGRLAKGRRVVLYDKRGCGLSDRARTDFSWEAELDDVVALLDQTTSGPVDLFAYSQGGPIGIACAARFPERVRRLALYGTYAWGRAVAKEEVQTSLVALVRASWGLGAGALTDVLLPGRDEHAKAREWFLRLQRAATDASTAASFLEALYATDVRALLPQVHCPTLVLHRRGDRAMSADGGRRLAAEIPSARFILLEGDVHLPAIGDTGSIVTAIESFLDEAREEPPPTRRAKPRQWRLEPIDRLGDAPVRPAFRLGVAQIGEDLPVPREEGLWGVAPEGIETQLETLERFTRKAAARGVDLLVFPELSLDLGEPAITERVAALCRELDLWMIPGAFHDRASHLSLARVYGPAGPVWEQPKHIPATVSLGGRRITEGIRTPAEGRLFVARTPFGRVAIAICRDWLDMDVRVALRDAEPAVDLVVNPALTPVTADFEAAHFEARRSLYAWTVFANLARFGRSTLCSPEKKRSRRRLAAGREGLLVADVDLVGLRAERTRWERASRAAYVQSTR